MDSYSIWNLVQPRLELRIKDKYDAARIKNIMKECILSDEAVHFIKSNLTNEILRGLDGCSGFQQLPMRVTFVTDQYKKAATDVKKTGQFLCICAHSQYFVLTLVKLNNDVPPEIHKKDFWIDPDVFKKPYVKVYEAFAKCIKNFFIEHHLDGELIPASFCTNLPMEQFSLDTAIIPNFSSDSKSHCQKDIKAFFEHVLQKDEFQDQSGLIKASVSNDVGNATAPSDLERSYHEVYEARLLGCDNVRGLESTDDFCHKLLKKFLNSSFKIGEPVQKIQLDVSHAGIKINDKVFKNSLYHHPIHKISHVILDFKNPQSFGYLCGDFLDGHQFFGFEADRSATDIVSLLRNIFEVELIRKKKEKLETQASKILLVLRNFLSLAHELKFRETEIPSLLKQRINMVKNINWWLEGSVDECTIIFEEPEEQFLHVSLQKLYAAACQLKLMEMKKEAAAKLEAEKLSGRRHRRKKKVIEKKVVDEDLQEKESIDPFLIEAEKLFAENILCLKNMLKTSELQLISFKERYENMKEEFKSSLDYGIFKDLADYCFSIFNAWNEEIESLNKKIKSLNALEHSERGKIKHEVISVNTGKKQSLRVTKKLLKVNVFEDTDFAVQKRMEKTESETLNNIVTCEEYFLHALKMRKEEIEDLNYFISKLHFRESISDPEDSKAVSYCRRLLIKAVKMRLKEVQDIEDNFQNLKVAKEHICYIIPNTIKCLVDQFKDLYNKKKLHLKCIGHLLSNVDVNLEISEKSINMFHDIFSKLMVILKKYIEDIEKKITEIQEKENSNTDIANICFSLYNQAAKMRKKEFDTIISDVDLLESIDVECYTLEDKQLLLHCQEEYMTAASMRKKEIEALEFQMKTAVDKFKAEDSQVKPTLKDLFYAAVEMEKSECEKILSNESNLSSDVQVLPVSFTFKDLYDVVAFNLEKSKLGISSFKDSQINTTLRDFLLSAFELKQKEIEIPMSSFKKDLENVLKGLIEDVKKRHCRRLLKHEIHEQALKISRSWKEVFLLAIGIRHRDMERIITSKRKEIIEEEAILKSMQDDSYDKSNNMANNVMKIWRRIFSDVINIKDSEMKKINEILKKSPKDQKEYMPKQKTESTDADKDEEHYEMDKSDDVGKEGRPCEEIMKAIASCKQIYDIALVKGSAKLEEMEYETRPIFSDEFVDEKEDLQEDEVFTAINKSCSLLSKFIENIKTEMSSIKTNLESLTQVAENIKSEAATAKSTSNHFLTLLLELEENALKVTEEVVNQLDINFEKLLSDDSETFRPFTDLFVDVLSDDGEMLPETEKQPQKKDKLELKEVDEVTNNKMTQGEIQSFLLEIEAELQPESDEQFKQIEEIIKLYETCKSHLEFSSEMRRESMNFIILEIENLKLPDPKKLKTKEKIQRALTCITICKDILSKSLNFRYQELKTLQLDIEKMKATQAKEQITVEYESSHIVESSQKLFLSAMEARRKNLMLMKNEVEKLDLNTSMSSDISAEVVNSMKSEIYTTCKDLVLESVDLKMKEIDDISSEIEFLNNVELKIGIHLKQLNPEKHKAAFTKLEKAKDAVVTCKKVCSSASERAKKEVKDTDELQLLKGAFESSEISLITTTCKNLLISVIERRELEISEMRRESCEVMEEAQNLLTKLDSLISSDAALENEKDAKVDDEMSESKKPSVESEVDKNVESQELISEPIDMEKICKIKVDMVNEFLLRCREILNARIIKIKEGIADLEFDADKIKVTVQKVEGEDSQVFLMCQSVFSSIMEMRRDEIKSFDSEFKVLQRLVEERCQSPTEKKKEENQEESELALAINSCKRILNLAIKNRKSEKDVVDFELMKLVRFQDSRITNICKQFLLTTLHKASEEMGSIKTKFLKIEGISLEDESEILDESMDVLKSLSQATQQQIVAFISDIQLLDKKKTSMEIEESLFVFSCKTHFSSQVSARQKEITIMMQELDNLSEDQTFEEGFNVKVINVQTVFEKICEEVISTRKKEIETFQFELIKHYNIKVAEEIYVCKKFLYTVVENFRKDLKMYFSVTEEILSLEDRGENEIWTALRKLQKLFSANLKKCRKYHKESAKILKLLKGEEKSTDKEKEYDVKAPLKPEACFEKLKTEVSIVIGACKEILYSVNEISKNEIRSINLVREEMKRQDERLSRKKEAFTFQDENSKFTEKELALLETLEQDVSKFKLTKNVEVIEFCDEFFLKSVEFSEALIQSTKSFLENLSSIEDEILYEASKLIHFMTNLFKSFIDELVKENHFIQEQFQALEDIKSQEKIEDYDAMNSFKEMLSDATILKKDIIAYLNLSLDSSQKKEECFTTGISKAYKNCGDLHHKVMEMIRASQKHLSKDLENLKQFGFVDEDLEELKLSEDEKAIKKCRLFLLSAIDHRKKLMHSINLELKFLKGSIQPRRSEDSKVFPSWYDRFLTFLDFQDEIAPLSASNFGESPSMLDKTLRDVQIPRSFHMKSNSTEGHLQELENYKNLLKSLEQKKKKQAIYTISSWEDLFLRSYLQNEIEKNINIEKKMHSYDISEVIIIEKSWEELLWEADHLMRKQKTLAVKLKESKQLFIPISSWSEVLVEAVNEWDMIVKKEAQQLQKEDLLLQWKGKMKSKKILDYSSGSQYGFKSMNFHECIKEVKVEDEFSEENPTVNASGLDLDISPTPLPLDSGNTQKSFEDHAMDNMLNKDLAPWDDIFSKSVDLIEEDHKAMNFMRKKNTKLQSQVINISSSWDELFSKAIMQRKTNLLDEINESNVLKGLAKVVNEEVQGTIKEQAQVIKAHKYDSWLQLIYDTSEEHRREILDALKAKKSEIEKSSCKIAVFERESADNVFLTLKPKVLIDKARKLMTDALEIRKSEIEVMEKELKRFETLISTKKCHSKKIPLSVTLWKLIVSVAVNFKTSGQKYEVQQKTKHFKVKSENLFMAALKSKLKETEDFEGYWKKFGEKQIFMQIMPINISWSELLDSVLELAKKDFDKMLRFGIKSEVNGTLESEIKVDDLSENLEAIEDSACWMDLIIEAFEIEYNEKDCSSNLEKIVSGVSTEENQPLLAWDEIFFLMDQMCQAAIKRKIFSEKEVLDYLKLTDIQKMVSSNFFTFDDLIIGIVEEVLWACQELSESYDDTVNGESEPLSFFNEVSEKLDENDQNVSLKAVLKKLKVKSFIDLLPSEAGAKKLELEDTLREKKNRIKFPDEASKKIEFNEETTWKQLFPIAVEVWQKSMETYLNFQCFDAKNECNYNNTASKAYSKSSRVEELSDSEHYDSNLNSLQTLEKMIAYEYLSNIEANAVESFSKLKQPEDQSLASISNLLPNVVADMKKKFKDGGSINPEYFDIMTTWHEMFKAALQRHKHFLKEIIDLQEIEEDLMISNKKPENSDVSEKKKLKFNAFNILNQEITLQDLFEVIDSLKKKNLIQLKELKRKEIMVEDTPMVTSENFEISKVIESFSEFFVKAYKFRNYEKNLLEEEIGQLMLVTLKNCHKYEVYPILSKLKNYFDLAIEKRSEENEIIHLKLENLNEFKSIIVGYLECPVTESVIKRNDKRIIEMNKLWTKIEKQQKTLMQKIKNCFNKLISALDKYLKRRKAETGLVDFEQANQLTGSLDVEHQETLGKLKKIFLYINNLRKKEVIDIEDQLSRGKMLFKTDESVENSIHVIISTILKFFENEIIQRKKAASLMVQEKDISIKNIADLKTKISSAFSNCKDFLLCAVQKRNDEISFIEFSWKSVKSFSKQPNKKTREILNLCEDFSNNVLTMRKAELKKLEGYLSELNEAGVPEVQSMCIEYISQSLSNRKNELAVISERIESLDVFDKDAENELSEAIEEALADVVDFSSGMTFFHTKPEKKEQIKDKYDFEVLKKCFDFYVKRREVVEFEIKVLEENYELLKFFKGDSVLNLIRIFEDFDTLLEKGLNAIEMDCNCITTEETFVKKLQNSFVLEIFDHFISCKNYFEESLNGLEQDIYILELQLTILNEDNQNMLDENFLDPSFSVSPDDSNVTTTDVDKDDASLKTALEKKTTHHSEESVFLKKSYTCLNSALEFRINYIDILSSETKSLNDVKNKVFHVLSKCYDNIFDMIEKRRTEREVVENILEFAKVVSETDIVCTSIKCLNCLLLYNNDCLTAIMPDSERLKGTLLNMKKKRSAVFDFCEKNLLSIVDLNLRQIKDMKADIGTMECMKTKEDSEYVTSSISIIQRGIEIRNSEITSMKNILENLRFKTEILPVIDVCRHNFQISDENRQEEIIAVDKQISILETEAAMLLLVYAPALENTLDENKKISNKLKSVRQKLVKIASEIKAEEEKIIQSCLNLYCNILETLKIEREAIKYDVDSLRKVEQESKYKIDAEGKEIIVSFKDLYLTAFDMKKVELEKEIRKQNVEENVKSKTIEIAENLLKEKQFDKSSDDDKFSEETSPPNVKRILKLSEEQADEMTFQEFVQYYDIKKDKRRSMIEQEIMDEFESIEKLFIGESFDIAKYSEEIIEDVADIKSRTGESFNRVYEVKMEEVEEDIAYKHEKITGAINMRRNMMEKIVLSKKRDLVKNISMKEREMKDAIESVRGMQSNVTCSLKDLYDEIVQLKSNSCDFIILQDLDEKFIPEKFQDFHVSVKLEKFLDIVIEIKEAELQMIVQSTCKKVDKYVSVMRREIDELIINSKEKLEEELKQYKRVQKTKAMEYAVSGSSNQIPDYVIDENKIFPDITSFQQYVNSFKGFFKPQTSKMHTFEDVTFRSEELSKNWPTHIAFFQKCVLSMISVPSHVLKLLEVEINSLIKILSEMNLDKAKAILHGVSFISAENASRDVSYSRICKGILLDIVAVLNDSTSFLMLGQSSYQNCEVALKLDNDCSLVYFEKAEYVKKWRPVFENINEIAIDVGLKDFGKSGCLDKIATKFDWAVTTVPMGPSIYERFISDVGILQQIKFAFLELHHSHLFCRNCNILYPEFSLSFEHVIKILNSKTLSNSSELLPLSSGTLSASDVIIANYVSRIILERGALLTAICLSSVLERIEKEKISIITSSFFIQESEMYRRVLKIFLSYLTPGKKVDFVYCNKGDCGVGASMMAAFKSHFNNETPGLYLLELEQHLENKNAFFSVQSFLNLMSNPELSMEAEELAKCFMKEMQFDLPLSVVWAHYFINEKIEEAENLYKDYPMSLAKVSYLVCQKISFTKNLELAKTYIEFLKRYGAEQSVKIDAYKILFDLLFYNEMYQEAVALVRECQDNKIPLTKLRHSTLAVLQDFCLRESNKSGEVPAFPISFEDFDTSDSDSDTEERKDVLNT